MKGITVSTPPLPPAPPIKLPKVPGAGDRARDQANDADSVFACTFLELDNGDTIELPPHPSLNMLPDRAQEVYEEYVFEVETTCGREPDIYYPQQTLDNGRVLPEETKRGALIWPYRTREGVLLKPPYRTRIVQIALGDDGYAKLVAGGKDAADVWRKWNEQSLAVADRNTFRPQTNGRSGAVAPVSR